MDVVGAVLEQDEPRRVRLQPRRGDLVIEVADLLWQALTARLGVVGGARDGTADGELVSDETAVGRAERSG